MQREINIVYNIDVGEEKISSNGKEIRGSPPGTSLGIFENSCETTCQVSDQIARLGSDVRRLGRGLLACNTTTGNGIMEM